jgi:hypothetical protein
MVRSKSASAELLDRAQVQHAGVVHQDVDAPAEVLRGLVDAGLERVGVGAVDLQRQRAAAFGLDGAASSSAGLRAAVAEGHGGAVARQAPHDGRADAARAAGDEGDLAGQHGGRREVEEEAVVEAMMFSVRCVEEWRQCRPFIPFR